MAFEIGPVRLIKEADIFCVCKSDGFLVPFQVRGSLFLFRSLIIPGMQECK